MHQTIKKVTADIDALSFNTAISQMMIFSNHLVAPGEEWPTIVFAEYFAGDKEVTKAMWRRNMVAIPWDIKYDPVEQNMNTDSGLVNALCLAAHIKPGGAALQATVCSTWV